MWTESYCVGRSCAFVANSASFVIPGSVFGEIVAGIDAPRNAINFGVGVIVPGVASPIT